MGNKRREPKLFRTLTNALMIAGLRLGLPIPPYTRRNALLLETRGRASGKRRLNPVGYYREGKRLYAVSEDGGNADYVKNALAAAGKVRVFVDGHWRNARLSLKEDEDVEAHLGRMNRRHASFVRRLATTPAVVVIEPEE